MGAPLGATLLYEQVVCLFQTNCGKLGGWVVQERVYMKSGRGVGFWRYLA